MVIPETDGSVTRKTMHEVWFHLVKSPRYFAAVDEVREPHDPTRWSGAVGGPMNMGVLKDKVARHHEKQIRTFGGFKNKGVFEYNPLGKLPGSVWNLTYWECVDRIERGWAPTGICSECGEGRRPVVDKELGPPTWQNVDRGNGLRTQARRAEFGTRARPDREGASWYGKSISYMCACPESKEQGLEGRCSSASGSGSTGTEAATVPPTIPPVILLNPPEEMMLPLVEAS